VASQQERKRQGDVAAGKWFAGATLNTRVCDGDCSHETFKLAQAMGTSHMGLSRTLKNGKYFDFCKTAYKPYDLAVNVVLIIAKHYLGSRILVMSDGESKDWQDGRMLCQRFLGYGSDFRLDRDRS
jgi:hypothetical protein